MKKLKIAMLGAGSGFVLSVAKELLTNPVFADCEFALMDPAAKRLEAARKSVAEILTKAQHPVHLTATRERAVALAGCDYVITSCEKTVTLIGAKILEFLHVTASIRLKEKMAGLAV